MDRRRGAAALLALAACIACSSAAPTASNPTALELHDGPTEGCYYNFQHYGEGDRIMTNEPCLNCTCHNRMLMCYLRVCPFTKAIGQDCTVEKRADQCCPIVTCPDVPVDLLTSTSTSSPAEYGPTGVGKLDKYGCSIHNKYFPEGSKVPSSPNKPCEHCYCIRNMTTCVMQECTLHVDGCTPIYHKDVCCPVRYSCDHSEDEIRLLDDMTTTVRPTQGFLLTTTTMTPVTQMTQDCIHEEQIFPDGASIKTDKACEHCYCMKGDIVCVVQECGTPMENEGKNCKSLPPRQGQCCPDTYICEGDEPSLDLTTETIDLTSGPPRRLGVEGSGYRNEPDEPITERGPFEHDIEGSGDVSETDLPTKVSPTIKDELLLISTEKDALYSQTTEADKYLNPNTGQISEKEPSVALGEDSIRQSTESILLTSTESKVTIADEVITSDGVTAKHEDVIFDTEAPTHSYEPDEILPTDISIDKETSINIPEQSTTMDEHSGYSVTEITTSIKKEPETGSTDSVAPYDVITTEPPIIFSVTEKDKSYDESSEINKIDIDSEMTNADVSVTEQNKPDFNYSTVKELLIIDDETTVSSNKDAAETTSNNPVDNEVDYIPGRIPGEGDCLLNGVTYSDNTSVPSTNNCHTGCKCISSIIKCDPIICSPPPEYMENMNDCQTSYDSPDACCPTFVCSAKETSLPQSHSQTSVTESSKPVAVEECNGNDCSSSEVKQPSIEPHIICDSGNCESGPKQNDCGINGCQGEEQHPLDRPVDCSGDKCSVSPTVSCEGENCETAPTEEKDVDEKTHTVSPNKPICNNDGGCDNMQDTSSTQDECNDETCRRKETFETNTNIHSECSGKDCKIDNVQKIPLIEPTIAPVTENILNDINTETNSDETQKTASPVPSIITPEKAITTESTTVIGIEPATIKEQLPTDIPTEEPIKLVTDSATGTTQDTATKIDNTDRIVTAITDNPQEAIIKSETPPTELIPMTDSPTEITKTSDEGFVSQEFYTRAPGQDESEAFTESRLVDYTSENVDTSPQEYTKETSQTTTQKSEAHSDIYETKPVESVTKLPIVMDIEKEINTMEVPNLPATEVKVTPESEDYPVTTEKLEALSVSDEKVGITLQPTKMQDNVETELPESAMEIEGGNEDHSELIPTEAQDLTSKIIQDGKTEDYNKFTTVKGITSPGVTENPEPVQTETQSILLETVSSDSTLSTEIHKTYTEVPQTVGTKSDIAVDSDSYITVKLDESSNKFEEPTTPSSGSKQPEEFSTKSDETIFGDGHSEAETEKQEYATTERKPSILNDDKLNVDLNLDVTERQTTISQMKNIDENEIEQEIQTKLPIVDKKTERTELQITTESHKESELGDFMDRDSQTVGVTDLDLNKDFVVTESAHPYTSNEDQQPASETTSKDQNLDLQTSTTSQDIFATKDTSTAPVLRDEGDTEIASETDKNIIKITTSSEESVTETKYVSHVAGEEELTTPLPTENVEPHQPTEDLKLTTIHLESPIETTTSVLISEEKQQTPDLGIPEKPMEEENESIKDTTTELPSYTKDIIDEEISSSRSPELISPIGDTTDIPSDKEKEITSSISNTKEEDVPENNLQGITPTTISNIHISESVTEKINMQPEEHLTQESSAEGSSEKPDVNENDLITESPYSQTSSIDFDKYSTIPPDEYAVDQTPKLPVSEINNDIKPIYTSIPLLTQDDEIITEKTGTEEKESSTEKAEYDVITVKNEQPLVAMSTESNTDKDIFPDMVTEDKHIEIMDKVTEISPAANESEKQNIGSSSSVQENENPSSEVLKQTTEVQFESELTTQQEHQTVASIPKDQSNTELSFEDMPTSEQTYTSSSKPYIKIEDVGTTESVPSKEEDSPILPEMPVENIYTINDLMTTEVVPSKHDELPKHPETTSMDTVLPEVDRTEGEQGINKIDSDTLTTESLITSKPSLFTSTEIIKTDTTKLIDMLEEKPRPSKVPEPVLESTSQSDTEGVTEQEDTEPYTTEKQYVSKSDQEEVPKIPELPVEQITAQTDTETVSKQEDFGTFTTEKQYVTKSDQGDIPKIPVLVDEQSNSQSDIESVTKFDDTESYNTEKQYVTKSDQDDIPKTPMLVDEQSNSQSDIESVTKIDDTESYNTEKQYVTKSDQDDIPNIPGLVDEQSNSQSDIESVTKSDDTESYNTEKQYVTESDEEVPEIPKLPEDQSTDQTLTENISKTEDSQSITTEGTYVTKLEQEIPKLPEQIEEQSTSHADIESVTKLEDTEPLVTEKTVTVTKSDQEEAPKITVLIDEQSTSPSDTESITKLNDVEPYTTEKQYVTNSVEDEVPKIPEPSEEQSTTRTDTEVVSKQEDSGSTTTEKQYVTKSVDEEIPKIPVLIDEQAISQSDVEGVTKLDDMEPFVTEKQYITNSDQEEIPKIPVVVDEESTSQSDVESITKLNDIEPYTTEKQFVTKSSEGVPETPELPNEQSTDRSDIEVVSKTEDAGPFTTERPYVTKLDQEVPKTPEKIEVQSTSPYESESVTKLEDTEPFVTEKQYVSNSDQETPNFPVVSEEQSTSRIDTESVTKMEDSGSDHEETSSHKLDTGITKPEQDNKNTDKVNTEPLTYPETTIRSELEGSGLFIPSEDIAVVPQKEDSPGISTTVSTFIPQKVETPIKTDTEIIDDFEKYSTERNLQTSTPADETVTLHEGTDAKPYEEEHKTPSKLSTEDESIYSETTPYSVLLEEHTHPVLEDTSSIIPIEEGSTTVRNEVQPERGDQIPDTPEINDEYERTTIKQIEEERTTSYEKISGPIVHSSDAAETTTTVEKITSGTGIQDEDKSYSPSMQDDGVTTPKVLPTIKDKEQDTTSPTMLEKEITTLGSILASSSKPELISSSSEDTQELTPTSTSKLQEESTTHSPPSEDKYKEKPLVSSPSSSEIPDILGEPHEDEHLPDFPPSDTGTPYGQEPDYVEEDQSFGPGTCRYGGKVYVSAQQIPRDDPCDFCFCFRSDIICLQQSCPPPIHGCHEEPIQGFCCPRYECPVSMATTMNITTTTTTTTTTLPPHFLPHAYKGAAQRRGCQIKGHSYKVGEVVRASSGPCLHCTCGGDGQMKCDPKACTPEPMLRQMIAAAVSAKRRR